MNEVFFEVRESPEGGYEARALGASIYTEGDDLEDIRRNISEAVACHFDTNDLPKWIHLTFVREEVLAVAASA